MGVELQQTRFTLLAALSTAALVGSCGSDEPSPATQVLVVVNSDLELGRAITSVRAVVQTVDGSTTVAEPFPFALAIGGETAAGKYTLPLSFGIAKPKGGATNFRVVVSGYGPLGAGGSDVKIAEQKAIASFQDGRSMRLTVFLGSVCFQRLCDARAGVDEVCYVASQGQVTSGQCGPVQVATLDDVEPRKELTGIAGSAPQGGASPGAPVGPGNPVLPEAGVAPVLDGGPSGRDSGGGPSATPDSGTPRMPVVDAKQCSLCTSPDYPCVLTTPPGYTCQGQFADWHMPDDPRAGAKYAPSFDISSPDVVLDKVTGLTWQRTVDPGMYTLEAAKRYCDTVVIAGQDDWRVPSLVELVSIADYTKLNPSIDTIAFPTTPIDDFWTLSSFADLPSNAWYVFFGEGTASTKATSLTSRVRCIRGVGGAASSATPADRYIIDPLSNTVADTRTDLLWLRGTSPSYDFSFQATTATKYCAGLGGGWRTPTLKELNTLVDPTRMTRIDPVAFPSMPEERILSATISIRTGGAWYELYSAKSGTTYRVRCVR